MRCCGRTSINKRCKIDGTPWYYPFCRNHQWQAITTLFITFPGIIGLYLGLITDWKEFWSSESKEEQYQSIVIDNLRSDDDRLLCVFNEERNNFKIMILPFINTLSTSRTKRIGVELKNRLETIKVRDSLNIDICYLDNYTPSANFNQDTAIHFLNTSNADLIIYGFYSGQENFMSDDISYNWISSEKWEFDSLQSNTLISTNYETIELRDLRKGKLQGKTDLLIYWAAGQINFFNNNFDKSIQIWSNVEKPEHFILEGIGRAYASKGDHTQAIKNLNKAIQLNPQSDFAYKLIAESYANLNQFQNAITAINTAINLTPEELSPFIIKSRIAVSSGNKPMLLKTLEEASKLDFSQCECDAGEQIYKGLAGVHLAMGNPDKANYTIEEGISKFPEVDFLYHVNGLVKMSIKDYNGAITAFKNAKKLGYRSPDIITNIAIANYSLGNLDLAYLLFSQAIEKDPSNPKAYEFFAATQIFTGNNEEAIPNLKKSLALYIQNPQKGYEKSNLVNADNLALNYYFLALAYSNLSNFEEAIENVDSSIYYFKFVLDEYMGKEYIGALRGKVQALISKNKLKEASEECDKILALELPSQLNRLKAMVKFQKGNIALLLGKEQEALKLFSSVNYDPPPLNDLKLGLEIQQLNSSILKHVFRTEDFNKRTLLLKDAISNYTDRQHLLETKNFFNNHIGNLYGQLSWFYVLAGKASHARQSANKGLEYDQTQQWIHTNLAHSYLLDNQIEKALKIYLSLVTSAKADNSPSAFYYVLMRDFDKMEKANLIIPKIEYIRNQLKENTTQLVDTNI